MTSKIRPWDLSLLSVLPQKLWFRLMVGRNNSGLPSMEIKILQKGDFSLVRRWGISAFCRWSGERGTVTPEWVTPKGTDMAQELLEQTQQSLLLMGEREKSYLQLDDHLLQRKVMTAGMKEGEKNSGQHLVWETIVLLPAPADFLSEPAKQVTGSRCLTPYAAISQQVAFIHVLCWPQGLKVITGKDEHKRTHKEVGSMVTSSGSWVRAYVAALACYCCLWDKAEHLQKSHQQDAAVPPRFNSIVPKEYTACFEWFSCLQHWCRLLQVLPGFLAHHIMMTMTLV